LRTITSLISSISSGAPLASASVSLRVSSRDLTFRERLLISCVLPSLSSFKFSISLFLFERVVFNSFLRLSFSFSFWFNSLLSSFLSFSIWDMTSFFSFSAFSTFLFASFT